MSGISFNKIIKSFGQPPLEILHSVSEQIMPADFISITGRSGSGKSTLLYILSTLDAPTSGKLIIDGDTVSEMDEIDIHRFRNQKMGFVFQFHHLLPELTALENVLMPAMKTHSHIRLTQAAKDILSEVDLKDKFERLPSQLSGGEQQRVAIARALIMNPGYLFADEPTGNLDSVNANAVMALFKKVNRERKTTVIYVTHDLGFSTMADRRLHLVDGRIVDTPDTGQFVT